MPANATAARAVINALSGGVGSRVVTALSSGDNAVTPPSGADFVIIELDDQSTVRVNLQYSGSDTGISLSRLVPTVLGFVIGDTASFNLESVSAGCNVWLTYVRVH